MDKNGDGTAEEKVEWESEATAKARYEAEQGPTWVPVFVKGDETSRSPLPPMELGMPSSRIPALFPDYKTMEVMIGPSTLLPGGEVVLDSGVRVTFALDKQNRVCCLQTKDPRVRLTGDVGVGTTYKDATTRFPGRKVEPLPGYGTLVNVGPAAWLGFPFEAGSPPADDTKAGWIEFRSDIQ